MAQGLKPKISTPHLVGRILLPCIIVLWTLFIFSNSGKPGDISGQISQQVTAILTGQPQLPAGTPLEGTLRKVGHLAEFAVLGACLMFCLRLYTRRIIAFVAWPLLYGMLVAVADEFYQLFVPDRSGQVRDVLLDIVGIGCGVAAAWLVLLIGRAFRRKP